MKSVLRPGVHLTREAMARSELLFRRAGGGPLAVFCPAYGRSGAALLRIYLVAEALRAEGWRTVCLPWRLTLAQRKRFLKHARPDVLVMQGARHALNRPALYPGIPVVYDLDDADFHLPHLAGAVQAAMTQVQVVVAGSGYIADWCRGQGARARVVWTGMPASEAPRPRHDRRGLVVAWAQTRPATYQREADLVLEVMTRLSRRHPGVRLRLYDRQPGEDRALPEHFEAAGIPTEWRPAMPLPAYLRSLDDVALGLAPLCPETPFSRGKSFGKVLAYLDRHVPVIASDAGEHGRFFQEDCGVVSNDRDVWVDRADALLAAPDARQVMAERGFALFRSRLSIRAAARQMAAVLSAEAAPDQEVARMA